MQLKSELFRSPGVKTPKHLIYQLFLLLLLSGCSDQPEFKPLDQYNPVSKTIGKAYIQQLNIGNSGDRLEPDVYVSFNKAFKTIYGVDAENAAIACVERDVINGLSENKIDELSKQLLENEITANMLDQTLGKQTIKNVVSDCLTPMAKKAYKKINRY